jgi:hypothetical protein
MAKQKKNMTISEILALVSHTRKNETKSELLREYNSLALRDILKGSFDDTIEWDLPIGAPPFEADDGPVGLQPGQMAKECGKLKYFVKGHKSGANITRMKKEAMFQSMLENVHVDDAAVLVAMKDKELNKLYKGITKRLVQSTWPNLIEL